MNAPAHMPPPLPPELTAALRVLEQEGPGALDLARVATRLGRGRDLERAALPWPTLRALRTDLAALGFHRLGQALRAASDESNRLGHGPMDRLFAAGRAYIRTAVASPALFALMRDAEAVDFQSPTLAHESSIALHALQDLVVELQRGGFEAERGPEALSQVVWDSVHRLTMRWADAALDGPVDADTVDEAISLELTLLLLDGEPPRMAARA